MASSASVSAVRRVVSKVAATTPAVSGTRQFHATGAKRYSNDYIHAEHMYDITAMKNRKVKMALGVFGSLALGTFVPIWAVHFQMKKQGGFWSQTAARVIAWWYHFDLPKSGMACPEDESSEGRQYRCKNNHIPFQSVAFRVPNSIR